MISIRAISLPVDGLDALVSEARSEGYDFLDRLVKEWESGESCFSGPGEVLMGVFDGSELVGIGGLCRDHLLTDPHVGRIRRVYLRAATRGHGVGTQLVKTLLERARGKFLRVRLRAVNADAARLYERLGFQANAGSDATHGIVFETNHSGDAAL